eukprot:gene9171-10124_t
MGSKLTLLTFVLSVLTIQAWVWPVAIHRATRLHIISPDESADDIDPNFEAHLPSLLKAGLAERPSPNLASKLRQKYADIAEAERKAAEELKNINQELSAELEEIADELDDTREKFVEAALAWDAWNRPSPDLPRQLRAEADLHDMTNQPDPNYEANLEKFLKAGSSYERPSPDLPSDLRILKLRNMAQVKRLAAKELRTKNIDSALAEELEEFADELDESTNYFSQLREQQQQQKKNHPSA